MSSNLIINEQTNIRNEKCFNMSQDRNNNTMFQYNFLPNIVNNSNISSNQKQYLPENAIEITLLPNLSKRKIFFKLKNLIIYLYIIIFEILFSRQRIPFLKHFKKNNNILIASINQSMELQNILDVNSVFYSYWFNEWNLVLSILKYKKLISHHVSRAHGFDLYENNGKTNYLPFRKFCLKFSDKIYTVSQTGELYLKKLYPKYINKFETSYLGTYFQENFVNQNHSNSFILVSSSLRVF